MNAIQIMLEALKDAKRQFEMYESDLGETYNDPELNKAIAAGEAELSRKATAIVCDCEGTTDDDGQPLNYALLYLDDSLPAGTELYTREEIK